MERGQLLLLGSFIWSVGILTFKRKSKKNSLRTLTIDDQLPASGFQLDKADSVFISFYSLARDERYWSDRYDLNEFPPERFLDDSKKKNNLSASIAFGGGHRQCMGQDLARFGLKIICARLMQSVTFGDGGPEVNAGGYDVTDSIKPRKIEGDCRI